MDYLNYGIIMLEFDKNERTCYLDVSQLPF